MPVHHALARQLANPRPPRAADPDTMTTWARANVPVSLQDFAHWYLDRPGADLPDRLRPALPYLDVQSCAQALGLSRPCIYYHLDKATDGTRRFANLTRVPWCHWITLLDLKRAQIKDAQPRTHAGKPR